MVFGFFKSKRSAHPRPTKGNNPTVEAGPPVASSNLRPFLYPNPLALNPPNLLHFIPEPKGQEETARIISGDLSATADLSHLISQADRLSKLAPELNLGGLVATQRMLRMGGGDANELLADQARAVQRLRSSRNRLLPGRSLQVSESSNSSFTSCDACKESFQRCSACYNTTKTSFPPPHSRNPTSEQLARLDKRPIPLGYDLASPASICPSLVETVSDNDDEGEICLLSHSNFGVVHSGAKVIDIGSANSDCCSSIVRFAVPFDSPRYYPLPSAGLPRPDSPTLPVEYPAPLFANRK